MRIAASICKRLELWLRIKEATCGSFSGSFSGTFRLSLLNQLLMQSATSLPLPLAGPLGLPPRCVPQAGSCRVFS